MNPTLRNCKEQIVIVVEEKSSYDSITNANKHQLSKSKVLSTMYDRIKQKQAANHVLLLQNSKEYNPAKQIAVSCVNEGSSSNNSTSNNNNIFGDIPIDDFFFQRKTEAEIREQERLNTISDQFIHGLGILEFAKKVVDLNKFIAVCRHKTLRRVPRGCEEEWSTVVKIVTNKIINSDNVQEKSQWFRALILLPHMFLPVKSSSTKILQHLSNIRPFNIDTEKKRSDGNHRDNSKNDHNTKQVMKHALEGNLKKSVKHLQQNSENTAKRLSHEETSELLDQKFLKRKPEDHFEQKTYKKVATFQDHIVMSVLKKMSKSAATALDGWCRDLLMTAALHNNTIISDMGTILAWIVSSNENENTAETNAFLHFNELTMKLLRASRLVGIPKPDNGIRPIVIGSFFIKFAGTCVLKRCGYNQIPDQYAFNVQSGAVIVGLKNRILFAEGKVLIRFDVRNAFNATSRKRCLQIMEEDNIDDDLVTYFYTVYSVASDLVMFGPDYKVHIIESDEGLRQGDSPSAYLFCLVMRRVRDAILLKYPKQEFDIDIFSYMDDKTIAVPPEIAHEVAAMAIKSFEENGFTVNVEKSSMICRYDIPLPQDAVASGIPVADNTKDFKMLGVNITDNFDDHNREMIEKIDRFFDAIDKLKVHPEIIHILLHFCGKPRLLYYCQTTPPKFGLEVVQHFDNKIKNSFAKLIGIKDINIIPNDTLHSVYGANIPDYVSNYNDIYTNTYNNVMNNAGVFVPQVKLTSISKDNFTSPECAHDRQWTHYLTPTRVDQLSPAHYQVALASRCGLLPDWVIEKMGETVRCPCGEFVRTRTQLAHHLHSCTQLSSLSFTHRHTAVKDSICKTLNRYGILTTNEPGYYSFPEKNLRPDFTVRLQMNNHLATDVTIRLPSSNKVDDIGQAASKAAQDKIEKYSKGVGEFGHEFIPLAMETTGHLDGKCFLFLKRCLTEIKFQEKLKFKHDFLGTISLALAQFRAQIILDVAARISLSYSDLMVITTN